MSFFTIVIPTYNRADLIAKTVVSVLTQSFQDFEIIIIDDGSTDNTEAVMKELNSDKITYRKQTNSERAAARNHGTKLANGSYITFLDSDDLFYTNHLQVAYDALQAKHLPELLHTRYEIIKPNGSVIEQKAMLNEGINRKLISGNFMSCNGVFLRKDIATANLFNEDRALAALEDWELWLRMASAYKIEYSNIITSAIVNHDERSVLTTQKDALINRMDTFMKYVLNNSNVVNYYKSDLDKFKSSCYTYVSLHLALTKKYRKEALAYLLKGWKENNSIVFSKRFYAILKQLF